MLLLFLQLCGVILLAVIGAGCCWLAGYFLEAVLRWCFLRAYRDLLRQRRVRRAQRFVRRLDRTLDDVLADHTRENARLDRLDALDPSCCGECLALYRGREEARILFEEAQVGEHV